MELKSCLLNFINWLRKSTQCVQRAPSTRDSSSREWRWWSREVRTDPEETAVFAWERKFIRVRRLIGACKKSKREIEIYRKVATRSHGNLHSIAGERVTGDESEKKGRHVGSHCAGHNVRGTNTICRVTADSQSIRYGIRRRCMCGTMRRLPDYACRDSHNSARARRVAAPIMQIAVAAASPPRPAVQLILQFIRAFAQCYIRH